MKDILTTLDPTVHRSYPRLRAAIQKAWDSITDTEVRDLVHTMHKHYMAIIAAYDWYTKY